MSFSIELELQKYPKNLALKDGKKGVLYLVEPSPEAFKKVAEVKLLGGKEIWSPMALSQGKLLVRSQSEMKKSPSLALSMSVREMKSSSLVE